MTGWRASRLAAAAAALLLLLAAGAAGAQAPRPLLPEGPLELDRGGARAAPDAPEPAAPPPAAAPVAAAPAPAIAAPEPPGGEDAAAGPAKAGIGVGGLAGVALETVGTLDAASGGFPHDMWAGTPRAVVARLVDLMPAAMASPAARDLRRRLLLTAAEAPAGPEGPAGDSLLAARARALFRGGEVAAARRLLGAAAPLHRDEALARLAADAAFLAGGAGLARACAAAGDWVALSGDAYWQKARAFCAAANGEWERAEFGVRLLVELGEEDEVFLALMRRLSGEEGSAPGMDAAALRPLDVAMARAARVALPVAGAEEAPAWALAAYADDPAVAADFRLAMAERAERRGAVAAADLATLYAATAPGDPAGDGDEAAAAPWGPADRAALYRAALAQNSPFGRAQAIAQASGIAAARGSLAATARLYAPMLRGIAPESAFGWFAADAALLHVAAGGGVDAARRWMALARREAALDAQARAGWDRAWPAIRLAAGGAEPEPARLSAWLDDRPEGSARGTALVLGLFEALGDPVPETAWRGLAMAREPEGAPPDGNGAGDAPAARPGFGFAAARALAEAARAGRLGETVALAILAAGTRPFAAAPAADLAGAVAALRTVGLEDEARRLAFEIALAAGFRRR